MFSEDPHANTRAAKPSEADSFLEFYKEHERLRGVASSEIQTGNQGSFLKNFLLAFLHADQSNARLLIPVMQELEKKYKLEDRFLSLQRHKTEDKTPGEPGLT